MSMGMWIRRRPTTVAGVAILLVAGGVVVATNAISSTKPSTGTFSGCLTAAGALTNVTLSPTTPLTCPAGTTKVTWTSTAPLGAQGATGLPGATGITGPAGRTGPNGADGATGSPGPVGATGPDGLPGAPGKPGPKGPTGDPGAVGATGAIGPNGPNGVTGANGVNGIGLLSGPGAPASALGRIGDTYLDTSTDFLYGPKTVNGWGTGHSIIGPAGAPGPTAGEPSACTGHVGTFVSTAAQLNTALATAQPGGVIFLAPGTYADNFVITSSGTQAAPISLCGSSSTILQGKGTDGGYGLHLTNANWWQFYGFTLTTNQKGFVLDGSNNNLVDRVTINNSGDEAFHFRAFSSNNTLADSRIDTTGLRSSAFGEGVYVGSAKSNWASLTNGNPDASNGNQILDNTIVGTTAENIDVKEGTTGGLISGNVFEGSAINTSAASAWINMKGNGWTVQGNAGKNSPGDGYQVHQVLTGWGQNDVFIGNSAVVNGPGYGYFIQKVIGDLVYCSNTASGAASGYSNVACTPGH